MVAHQIFTIKVYPSSKSIPAHKPLRIGIPPDPLNTISKLKMDHLINRYQSLIRFPKREIFDTYLPYWNATDTTNIVTTIKSEDPNKIVFIDMTYFHRCNFKLSLSLNDPNAEANSHDKLLIGLDIEGMVVDQKFIELFKSYNAGQKPTPDQLADAWTMIENGLNECLFSVGKVFDRHKSIDDLVFGDYIERAITDHGSTSLSQLCGMILDPLRCLADGTARQAMFSNLKQPRRR